MRPPESISEVSKKNRTQKPSRGENTAKFELKSPELSGWKHLVGHDALKDRWFKLVQRQKLPPLLLLVGREGLGKEALLMYLAGLLYCDTGSACGACPSCLQILAKTHSEIFWPEMAGVHDKAAYKETPQKKSEGAEPLLLEDALKIQEHLYLAAGLQGRFRTVIIPDADRLNIQATNRLLKIFEELPENCFVLMSTCRKNQLLPTLLSRLVKWHIRPPSLEESVMFLQGVYPIEGLTKSHLKELLLENNLAPGSAYRVLQGLVSQRPESQIAGEGSKNLEASLFRPRDDKAYLFREDCFQFLKSPQKSSTDRGRSLNPMPPLKQLAIKRQEAMKLSSTWGKALSPKAILDNFEKALHRHYLDLLHQDDQKKDFDPFMIDRRRGILAEARKLAVKERILLSSTLLLENIALTSIGNESICQE